MRGSPRVGLRRRFSHADAPSEVVAGRLLVRSAAAAIVDTESGYMKMCCTVTAGTKARNSEFQCLLSGKRDANDIQSHVHGVCGARCGGRQPRSPSDVTIAPGRPHRAGDADAAVQAAS